MTVVYSNDSGKVENVRLPLLKCMCWGYKGGYQRLVSSREIIERKKAYTRGYSEVDIRH